MNQSQPQSTQPAFAAFIGLDWADQKHDICLQAADSAQVQSAVIEHTPEALAAWVASLRARYANRPVAIALEATRSGLLYALMAHDFIVLYPLPTTMLANFRKAFHSSGSKNDPTDAALALAVLLSHRGQLRAWKPDDAATRKLALLCETRRKLVNQRTALVQQLSAALKSYFPQALDCVGDDLASPLACDFLSKWPTLSALQAARPDTVRNFYYGHRCRRADLIEGRLQQLQNAVALTADEAVVETATMFVAALVAQLRALRPSLQRYDQKIAEVFAAHPDRAIFESLPGAGSVLAPRLLAAFGSDRSRHPSAKSLQQFSGIAPVTIQSGRQRRQKLRRACPKFLRQTFHEFAGCSLPQSEWAHAAYQRQRAAGKGHHAAVRSVAFKWQRILWRLWQDRALYDEARYVQTLQRRGSPLWTSPLSKAAPTTTAACA